MGDRVFFEPCSCEAPYEGCFRCAVDFVIISMGWNLSCDCLRYGKRSCGECQLHEEYRLGFAMADAPYSTLAMERMKTRGHVWDLSSSGGGVSRQVTPKAAESLLDEAKEDAISHFAALHLFQQLVSRQQPAPDRLLKFVGDVAIGNIQAPKLKGKYRGATKTRDKLIAQLIFEIVGNCGLKPTSSDEGNGQSACHAVARAFALLRLKPSSYRSILRIWKRRGELLTVDFPGRV